jgi:hypothetical protein
VQDGRIYIELINAPFLFREHATPAEYSAGLKLAIDELRLRSAASDISGKRSLQSNGDLACGQDRRDRGKC